MATRGNYGFEKRQKEIKRKQKADAKLERRRAQREDPTTTVDGAAGNVESDGPKDTHDPDDRQQGV